MKKFIIGFIIGLILGSSIGVAMAGLGTRMDNERDKFVADSNGNPTIRVVFSN